ncbi:MAG: zinc-ribbon domain-containing protein [Caldilineales bacterium]|nr:zinc-ribbon domain-containing protein [Caldilineales bacterium]
MPDQAERNDQPPGDARIQARQRVQETEGEVVGIDAEEGLDAPVEVKQDIGAVGAGGSVTGVRIGGGKPAQGKRQDDPKPYTDADRQNDLRAQLNQYERNLADLKLREAQYGLDAPTYLQNEIRETQNAIDNIKHALDELAASEVKPHFCSHCGAAAAPTASFCTNCGKPL